MLKKPHYVVMSESDWKSLTDDQQQATLNNYALVKAKGGRETISSQPPRTPSPSGDGTAAKKAPEPKVEATPESTPDLAGIRNWTEAVVTASRVISAERIRNCIIYQLDVKKDPWYTMRLTKGFVKAKAEKLDDDTPEDFVWEKEPLLREKKIRTEENGSIVEMMITKIERQPKNNAERIKIRERFGVNPQTIPFLAKKGCSKCSGTGVYSVSSYPGDPVYERLTESVECSCSYE